MLLLLLACQDPAPPIASDWPTLWTDDPCADIDATESGYGDTVARWTAEEALAPTEPGQLVVTGSSTIRRWEGAFEALAPWGVVQRGFGGARITEVARFADALVAPHHPAGVLLFAGTNDMAFGAEPEEVVTAFRCFADRTWASSGQIPILYAGMTPTPARWSIWEATRAANEEIAALAEAHPGLVYIDIPTPFLATGQPPDAALFVDDGLHLSEAGYALWTDTVLPVVTGALPPRAAPTPRTLPAQTRVRVDLGPSNAEDGAPTSSPDPFGLTWNNWHARDGGDSALAGEVLGDLRGTHDEETGWRLVITGGFQLNGLRNGGLSDPDGALLGTLAVSSATGDYFFTNGPDNPGGLAITGLDPAARYTLRLFASRLDAAETRVTRYTARGANEASATLTTTGPGVGVDGRDGNTSEVVVLSGLAPSPRGLLVLDVSIEAGSFGYLSLLEIEVE